MNPSGGGFNNPPPPGTEVCADFEDDYGKTPVEDLAKSKVEELRKVLLEYEGESSAASSKIKSESGEDTKSKIDRIDPFLKNPEYLEYEKRRHSRDRSRHRRRSHSRSRHSERRKKSNRSRSRESRHRRTRSRDRRSRRHRSSSSSRSRHGKSKREKRHKRSRSRRRSHSRSRRHKKSHRDKVKSDSEREDPANTSGEVEEEDEPGSKENAFKNDGSFLEMFKKLQEEQQKVAEQASSSDPAPMIPPIAKRRGGRILKTGLVEKTKVIDEFMQGDGMDAWSVYMKEVKRYKEACCDDDSKTRPLVK